MKKSTPEKRGRGRPATGQTPLRHFRIDDELWGKIVEAAGASGETISDYVRRVMERDAKRVLRSRD